MREPELAARVRQADLAVVHVAGEHEVERAPAARIDDAREVAEEDAEVRVRVGELPAAARSWRSTCAGRRRRAGRAGRAARASPPRREEQRRRPEVDRADRLRERVAAVGEVVVAEHGEDRRGSRSTSARSRAARRAAARARSPVTRTRSGSRSRDPVDRALDRARPAATACPRWKSERWAIRRPSSSGGSPGSGQSSVLAAGPSPPRTSPQARPPAASAGDERRAREVGFRPRASRRPASPRRRAA